MDYQVHTNAVDVVLCEVLARHRGFRLQQSARTNSIWFARIQRDRSDDAAPIADLDVDVRDALYAHHLQLRSAKIGRDQIDLQIAAPDF